MTVEYNGENSPVFRPDDWTTILNGSLASSVLARRIAMNQTWLAVQDVEAANFLTDSAGQLVPFPSYAQTEIWMPPFSQYVELWFLCERNGKATAPAYQSIQVQCPDTGDAKVSTLVFAGSDPTGKANWSGSNEARWVVFKGIAGASPSPTNDPMALKCVSTPVNAWTNVRVRYASSNDSGIGGDVKFFTAFYRVVPREGSLQSWA